VEVVEETEAIGVDFLVNLQHVADDLNATPFTYTVRTETALEESTYLALHVNQNDGEYGIHQNDAHAYHYTFEEYRQTFRHQGS
jgi:hypothetical protein